MTSLSKNSTGKNSTTRFIHFGCWNYNACDITLLKKDSSIGEQSKVMKLLNDTIKETEYDFISIAGDNYYGDKMPSIKEKVVATKDVATELVATVTKPVASKAAKEDKMSELKVFNTSNFYSGLHCLPDKITKYVVFGNHDVEKYKDVDNNMLECISLNKQQEFFNKNKEYNVFNDIMVNSYLEQKTIILFIDTSIYLFPEHQLVKDTCYKYLFTDFQRTQDPEKLTIMDITIYQNMQIKAILSSLPPGDGNIIIVGHDPIVTIRTHEKENKRISITAGLVNLFKSLKDQLTNKSIYYLCADVHLYQAGVVNIKDCCSINQYVVGTGGAKQDNIPVQLHLTNSILEYTINPAGNIQSYGFITVTIDPTNKVIVDFISSEMTGGYYKKYIKYKNKYINAM